MPPASPFERIASSVLGGVICSAAAGAIFGGSAAMCLAPDPFALLIGGYVGGICGLCCSPAFIFALYQRARVRDLSILFGITLGVSVVFSLALGPASVVIAVPTWLAGLIGVGVRSRARRRLIEKIRDNRCLHCGYDLSGNATGRCPECGQLV